jgi:hypothetical protein
MIEVDQEKEVVHGEYVKEQYLKLWQTVEFVWDLVINYKSEKRGSYWSENI